MKTVTRALIASMCFVRIADSAQINCRARAPGLYVSANGSVQPLLANQDLGFDPSARLLFVGGNPSGFTEGALNITVTSMASQSNVNRKVNLSRNKISSVCSQDFATDYIGDNEGNNFREVWIREYDNHVNKIDRQNPDIMEWNFRWWQGSQRGGHCRRTLDKLRPLEATNGRATAGGAEIALSTSAARASSRPIESNAGISSVLIHQPLKQRACYTFSLIRGSAKDKALTTTRIQMTDLSMAWRQGDLFVIKWK